jgi:hypothetical protein
MNAPSQPFRLRRAIQELAKDADRFQLAAGSLEDVAADLTFDADPDAVRRAMAKIQAGAVALAISLLGIAARAERAMTLAELEAKTARDEDDEKKHATERSGDRGAEDEEEKP